MNPGATRALRWALLASAFAVLVGVGFALRRPPARAEAPPAPTASATPALRADDVVYRSMKGGREAFVLRARRMLGREHEQFKLEEVNLEFSYAAEGKDERGTITSDECVYFPTRQQAFFQGHVRLRTQDGFELDTEQLVYDGQGAGASSDYPVEFRRGRLSGRSRGLRYETAEGRVELPAEVFVIVSDPKAGATQIRAERAELQRQKGELEFAGDVQLTRPTDELRAGRLILYGAEDEVDRARAVENVVLRMSPEQQLLPAPHGARAGSGRANNGARDLRCHQLDMNFRPDGTLEDAAASEGAELVVHPGPGEPRERRVLRGSVLAFRWDEHGRLSDLSGQKDTEFRGEPAGAERAPARVVRARNFLALFEPESGATRSVEFNKDVEFERGAQRAKAGRAYFEGEASILTLREEPVLWDAERGTRLEAETIEVFTQTGNLRARYNLKHTIERRDGGGILDAEEGPVFLTGRLFSYDAKTRSAVYTDSALLRSGKSEVRAAELTLTEREDGQAQLRARGGVTSRFVQPAAKEAKGDASLVEGRAQQMTYDEAQRLIVYSGDAVIKQGEVDTKSPEARITLTPDGRGIQQLVAGEPVELAQGVRTANGRRAVYTPAEKTIVITGEKVELKDPSQQVQGRSVTFYVGNDRIFVDGKEEVRTETVLRRNPEGP
jgi:LPS export ABC transporter protein LptC/lipopolysaccharide transport protein LptA